MPDVTEAGSRKQFLGLKKLGKLDMTLYGVAKRRHPNDTNRWKCQHDPLFLKACGLAEIPATRRQYSKYTNGRGLAYAHKNQARLALQEDE